MPDCIGCLNIHLERFPFKNKRLEPYDPPPHEFIIDMEGQGVTLDGKRMTEMDIFYCPVCGKRLIQWGVRHANQ